MNPNDVANYCLDLVEIFEKNRNKNVQKPLLSVIYFLSEQYLKLYSEYTELKQKENIRKNYGLG